MNTYVFAANVKVTSRTTDALEAALGARPQEQVAGNKFWIVSKARYGTRREYAEHLLALVNAGLAKDTAPLDEAHQAHCVDAKLFSRVA